MSTAAAPITFNGLSQYSSDFQAILNRQVSIAQLPLQQLQNQQATELQQKAALVALAPEVDSLGTAISALSSLGSGQGLAATSSDPTIVTAVNNGDTNNATYTISNVTALAAPASETSLAGYADATTATVSTSGKVNLVYGVNTYHISLTASTNNLNGLAAAINNLNVGVSATVLTTGTGATPDYLTLSASSPGLTTLQLQDVPSSGSPVDLISATNQGLNSSFDLNGLPVVTSSNTVNSVIPGLTFTLLGTTTGTQSVALSLSPDAAGLSSALQSFAQSYNALAAQVAGQVGQGAGALAGNSLVYELSSDLQQVSSYHGTGSIGSLADLGLTFGDATGQIIFDPSVVAGLSDSQLQDAFTFLGSATTGFGSLSGVFTQLGDPIAGVIVQQEAADDTQNTNLTDKINTLTTQIASFQANLTARLTTADEAVSELQNQLTSVNATLQGLDVVLYGKQVGSNGI